LAGYLIILENGWDLVGMPGFQLFSGIAEIFNGFPEEKSIS
jgi:hypothetical protein